MPDPQQPPLKVPAYARTLLPDPPEPDYGYGQRWNSTDPKGLGFFGNFVMPPQPGREPGVMGELSIDEPIDGHNVQMPSLVPTLTHDEVVQLLNHQEGQPIPDAIRAKAIAFARQRLAGQLPPFARTGEQRTDLYPDLPRAPVPTARPRVAVSHQVGTPPPVQPPGR